MNTKGFVTLPGQQPVWNIAPGRTATLKLQTEQTGESVMVFEEVAPAGTETPLHLYHHSDEVMCVLSGQFTFKLGESVTDGGAGACIFMPRGIPHAWKNSGAETGPCALHLHTGRGREILRGVRTLAAPVFVGRSGDGADPPPRWLGKRWASAVLRVCAEVKKRWPRACRSPIGGNPPAGRGRNRSRYPDFLTNFPWVPSAPILAISNGTSSPHTPRTRPQPAPLDEGRRLRAEPGRDRVTWRRRTPHEVTSLPRNHAANRLRNCAQIGPEAT
jgi:quercetin dioxygenase-like cupin family protein